MYACVRARVCKSTQGDVLPSNCMFFSPITQIQIKSQKQYLLILLISNNQLEFQFG